MRQGWGAKENAPLYAFAPENCIRTSEAWAKLREHRLNELPTPIVGIIRQRGFRRDSSQRERYDREQREVEAEIMDELRDELSRQHAGLENDEQRNYEKEIARLNDWIRERMKDSG